jgi:cysteinyl-tRNA synthetase
VATDLNLIPDDAIRLIETFDLVFGLRLLELSPQDLNIRPSSTFIDEAEIFEMIDKRNSARNVHDFKKADEIRNELVSKGVSVMDTNEGSSWEWLVLPE